MFEGNPKRVLVIACEVVFRELAHIAARSPKIVDFVFLPKGLHDLETEKMRARLQEEIDKADAAKYEAVVLGYGLCNNGTLGLKARELPLVIPRAHDCITFFFGSRGRYAAYFDAHPGTYYHTTGWTERGTSDLADGIMSQLGLSSTYNEYLEKYGRENAEYIMEMLGGWKANYKRLAYVRMPLAGLPDYADDARAEAAENGWEFDLVDGDAALLDALVNGRWDAETFQVVAPGGEVADGVAHDAGSPQGAKE